VTVDWAKQWDRVVDLLDYPMYVVTTVTRDGRAGCLVGFATQASIDPPRWLVGISDKNHTYRVAREADRLAVHVLGESDRDLAALFGEQTGDDVDKFAQCAWHDGPEGVPILDDAVAWFSGPILSRDPVGDHVAHLIEIDAADVLQPEGALLTFSAVRDFRPGHEA
jgi:flavin reductase (DIM6/NTAB) family NADH-FMN oxidoreductase RutF